LTLHLAPPGIYNRYITRGRYIHKSNISREREKEILHSKKGEIP